MCIGCSRRVNGWGFRGKCERKLGDARGKHEVGGKGGEGGWGNREMRRGGRGAIHSKMEREGSIPSRFGLCKERQEVKDGWREREKREGEEELGEGESGSGSKRRGRTYGP